METLKKITALSLAAFAMAAAAPAQAAWPEHPIKLVVPYPPGGNADNITRLISERLTTQLGQPVVVENRGGAGGSIGAQSVSRAASDGYTFLMAPTAIMAITPLLRKVPYDPASFEPVAMVSGSYGIVTVRKDLPFARMTDLVAAAKAQPGKLTFGSAGLATLTHLSGEIIQQEAGIKLLHVPYKGSMNAMSDLLGGRIDMIFDSVALPQIKVGKLRGLAVTSKQRHPELPDVPTLAEAGISFENRSWFGLFAPKGTPAEAIGKLSAAVEKILKEPEVVTVMLKFSQFPDYKPASRFAAQVKGDTEYFKALIEREHIKVE